MMIVLRCDEVWKVRTVSYIHTPDDSRLFLCWFRALGLGKASARTDIKYDWYWWDFFIKQAISLFLFGFLTSLTVRFSTIRSTS
jgi:hypothetical protein